MGIDKSLWDRYPSVLIHGQRYHYGREKEFGQYLVEHELSAKNRWSFDRREDLEAFLINLPASADRDRLPNQHPDWHDATPERRTTYVQEDMAKLRVLAEEKVKAGTAPPLVMDFKGEHGPHTPQRLAHPDEQTPLERAEERIAELKATKSGEFGYAEAVGRWPADHNDALKLRLIEGEVDWSGVEPADKAAILTREVDFARITPGQLKFVFQDIAFDNFEPGDPTVATKLFEEARSAGPKPGGRQDPLDQARQRARGSALRIGPEPEIG